MRAVVFAYHGQRSTLTAALSVFAISLLVSLATASPLVPTTQANGFQYGIQLDAGSSGTRAYVYKWHARIFSSLPPSMTQVSTQDSWSKKQKPGISDFSSDPKSAGESIQPLLDFCKDTVLKAEGVADVSGVPVFLGATAGMRMLPPATVTAVLESVRAVVESSGFLYQKEWIRVLSGEEEGVFGWVAANSLLGQLNEESVKTIGALDLGGASTQATFHPEEEILAGFFPLTIAQTEHRLYTHSYLYYGADQARFRMYDDLVAASPSKTTVTNPCFPTGYEGEYNGAVLVGSSDWSACLAAASKLITDFQKQQCLHSNHERCSFDGVYMPAIQNDTTFLAMSSFFYTWSFFQLPTGAGADAGLSGDLAALVTKAEAFCSMDAKGQAAYNNSLPHPQSPPYVYDYCFGAAYSHALLRLGYGMQESETPIQVSGTINGNSVSWAYGAMIWEINRLGWSYDGAAGSEWTMAAKGVLAALLVVLVVDVVVIGCWCYNRTDGEGGENDDGGSYAQI